MPLKEDPFGNYYFALEIDNTEIAHFMECSSIKVQSEVYEISEGGLNGTTHKKPKGYKWDNITLRYALSNSTFRIESINSFIQDEEEIKFGQFTLEALHTPGHSSGSMCFKIDDGKEQHLFSGDTLFNRSVGRTDLPTGDSDTLLKSIKQRLYTLDSDTKVIPGHGPSTLIGEEKRSNPFVSI